MMPMTQCLKVISTVLDHDFDLKEFFIFDVVLSIAISITYGNKFFQLWSMGTVEGIPKCF